MREAMILAGAALLGACNFSAGAKEAEASGERTGRDYQVAGFDRVSLIGPHDVIVTVGGPPSVRAEGDSKLIEKLEISVENGELKIGSKKKFNIVWKGDRNPLAIHVTVPSLSGVNLSGSGDLKVDRVEGRSFAASVSGSGDIDIGSIKVEQANFALGGSGDIKAAGAARTSEVSLAGSGDLDLGRLEVQRAQVSLAGSGDVLVRATEAADISLVGSGDVTLAGGAKCNISKRGSGEVRCIA
jgi:hypothetical protein